MVRFELRGYVSLKRLFTADNIAHAGLIQSFLDQHDIPTILRNEHTSAVIGDLPFVDNQPEVWVDEQLYAQANRLLEELKQEPRNNTEPWQCSNCQESNPGNFELCWQCSQQN